MFFRPIFNVEYDTVKFLFFLSIHFVTNQQKWIENGIIINFIDFRYNFKLNFYRERLQRNELLQALEYGIERSLAMKMITTTSKHTFVIKSQKRISQPILRGFALLKNSLRRFQVRLVRSPHIFKYSCM